MYFIPTAYTLGYLLSRDSSQKVDGSNWYLIEAKLSQDFYESIQYGEYAGLGSRIADRLAEMLMPEMEQRILSDPEFKDRVIGDILVRIANRLADKGFLEKEEKKEDASESGVS